jgi:hypothetical protein
VDLAGFRSRSREHGLQALTLRTIREADAMSDDKRKRGRDRKTISLDEEYEVRDWTRSLGVTREELAEAVAKVGHSADRVREHLASRKK